MPRTNWTKRFKVKLQLFSDTIFFVKSKISLSDKECFINNIELEILCPCKFS